MSVEEAEVFFDFVLVGAGLSGIGAAIHISEAEVGTFVVLEGRETHGGTWDLFRYPGVRSDVDMYSYGYECLPWLHRHQFGNGAEIKDYIGEAIQRFGLAPRIRYGQEVRTAEWRSAECVWRLVCQDGRRYRCRYLVGCVGYFDYEHGHEPELPGAEDFKASGGLLLQPQRWPAELDFAGRRVAIIGSGATAVTMAPAMSKTAAHVTVVQRTPGYIVPVPVVDPEAAALLDSGTPPEEVSRRRRQVKIDGAADFLRFYKAVTPEKQNRMVIGLARKMVPEEVLPDVEFKRHFTPPYNLWEQRPCLALGADFFVELRKKRMSMTTGSICKLIAGGLQMEDGEHVPADIIVSATGLELHSRAPMSTMQVRVDGVPYIFPVDHLAYKGCMLTDVPNFVFCLGYFQLSWTLKVEMTAKYICNLARHAAAVGAGMVVPRRPKVPPAPFESEISSGYVRRAVEAGRFPSTGTDPPWAPLTEYSKDYKLLLEDPVDKDGVLEFLPAPGQNSRL